VQSNRGNTWLCQQRWYGLAHRLVASEEQLVRKHSQQQTKNPFTVVKFSENGFPDALGREALCAHVLPKMTGFHLHISSYNC